MTRQSLVVMVKEPHPGRVKTRLGRELGMIAAAWWFRHQVARLLRRVEDPRWRLVLAVSPSDFRTRSTLPAKAWRSAAITTLDRSGAGRAAGTASSTTMERQVGVG